MGSGGEEWLQQLTPGGALTLSPTTNTPHPKWELFPDAAGTQVMPCVGGSIRAGRERVRDGSPVPPSSSSVPKTTSLRVAFTPPLPSHVPSRSRVSLTESSQPQEQKPQQAGRRGPGQGNHGLPWPRRSQGRRLRDTPSDRCWGRTTAGAEAGAGPLTPRAALARVCVRVPVVGWGPTGTGGGAFEGAERSPSSRAGPEGDPPRGDAPRAPTAGSRGLHRVRTQGGVG